MLSDVVQESEVIINGIAESSNYQATAVAQIEQAITQVICVFPCCTSLIAFTTRFAAAFACSAF